MRNYKFKAIFKETKEVFDVEFLGEKTIKLSCGEWENRELFNVVQYTGLEDFHGDDIFEGDVLEDAFIRGLVVFDEGKFIFEWGNIAQDLFEVHDELAITGNSFENPELLEAHNE